MKKADKKRIDDFRKIGCIVTRLYFEDYNDYDVHHLIDGYRAGDNATIPLNPWYHRGVAPSGMSDRMAYLEMGPSLAKDKTEFVKRFGTEKYLLEQTNKLLGYNTKVLHSVSD